MDERRDGRIEILKQKNEWWKQVRNVEMIQ